MKLPALSREEVLKNLITSEGGLSDEDVKRRVREYGLNEIREVTKTPLYRKLIAQFTHVLAILLWIAAALCFLSEHLRPGEGMLSLGIAIIGVIVINAIFTFVQEYRVERSIEALKRLLPFNVKVVRSGSTQVVPAREVVPGDVILLAEGDKVPADARIIESSRLMVNNAPLTGESEPKLRNHTPSAGDYLKSPNIVFAGTHVVSGSATVVAYATGMSTEFGRIAHLTSAVEEGLSPLQREIVKVTRVIALIAVTTGIFFFGVGTVVGKGFWHNILFAVGITIANVPEGLLPTVTLALAMGSQRMARKNALIKTLTSVETLGSVTVICADKTGTLTQNKMEVQRIWTPRDHDDSRRILMDIAYLCNNAVYDKGAYRGDPTEVGLLKVARERSGGRVSRRLHEIPFDSDRKRMTTVNVIDGAAVVLTKGAVESIQVLCTKVLVGKDAAEMVSDTRESITRSYHEMMDSGLRVIGFACKTLGPLPDAETGDLASVLPPEREIESDLVFAGIIGLEDPPRPEVPDAVRKCKDAGIRVVMMTGDASLTAVAIARQIGLAETNPTVVEGDRLDVLPDLELRTLLSSEELIFSRMSPRHKMRVVSLLKDEGERVAVTGDGVNDAPALKKADIGVAMGMTGTDVAKEAADVVLLDDNFATIVNAVEEGRTVFENIKKFITYIFAHGTPEAIPYVMFAFLNIPLPLTVMQILAIDLGTETIPALALGNERPEARSMMCPPRPLAKGLIDRTVLFRGYLFIGLISTVGVLFAYFFVLFSGGWRWGVELPMGNELARQASSATFLGIVILQVGNVFACRSSTDSVLSLGIFSNRLVSAGIVFELALAAAIIYHPLGNRIFGTAPISSEIWLMLIPFSLVLLFADEMRKWYVRKKLSLSEAVGGRNSCR